jgi:hypothetical protein
LCWFTPGWATSDQTIRWLEKAYEERSDYLLYLHADPLFHGLRNDRRFQNLERKIGVEP